MSQIHNNNQTMDMYSRKPTRSLRHGLLRTTTRHNQPHDLPATPFQLHASVLQMKRNRHPSSVGLHDDWRRPTDDEFLELLHTITTSPSQEKALRKDFEEYSTTHDPSDLFPTQPRRMTLTTMPRPSTETTSNDDTNPTDMDLCTPPSSPEPPMTNEPEEPPRPQQLRTRQQRRNRRQKVYARDGSFIRIYTSRKK